jgi:hypothetical protein
VAITNGYCSLSQIKAAMRITDTADDTLLENSVESASRLIDSHCARQFWSTGTATPRVFVATTHLTVDIDDLSTTSGLVIKTADDVSTGYTTTWDTTDYQLEPLNGVVDGLSWPYDRIRAIGDYWFPSDGGEALIQVTGVWGWAAIPKAIEQAALLQAARIFKRYDSPLGVAGFGDLGVMRVSRGLDSDVAQLVEPFRRMRQFA